MKYDKKEQEWSNQFAWNLVRTCRKYHINMDLLFIEIGLTVREKNRILAGHNVPLHKICKIAMGMNVDPSELLSFGKERTVQYSKTVFENEDKSKLTPFYNKMLRSGFFRRG